MSTAAWLIVVAGAASLAAHLWSVAAKRPVPRALFKALCSAGFVLLGLLGGASSDLQRWMLAGLVLCAVGDLALLSAATSAFLLGLASFLGAHLAYAMAFAPLGRPSALAGAAILLAAALTLRWLWPGLGRLKLPVIAYCGAIGLMLWLAFGTGRPVIQAGAALFFASDLAVARERFVRPGLVNQLVGLPPYYLAQYLLAWSAWGA